MGYRTLGLLGFGLAAVLGCEARPTLVPVSGKVTMGGNPVEGAMVLFLHRSREGEHASGMTDPDGNFKLATYISANETPEGALPGDYDVIIDKIRQVRRTPDLKVGMQSYELVNLLPEKYSMRGSGLQASVKKGEANEFLFDLDVDLPKPESPPAGRSSRSPDR
jgi:hypothetical protein